MMSEQGLTLTLVDLETCKVDWRRYSIQWEGLILGYTQLTPSQLPISFINVNCSTVPVVYLLFLPEFEACVTHPVRGMRLIERIKEMVM